MKPNFLYVHTPDCLFFPSPRDLLILPPPLLFLLCKIILFYKIIPRLFFSHWKVPLVCQVWKKKKKTMSFFAVNGWWHFDRWMSNSALTFWGKYGWKYVAAFILALNAWTIQRGSLLPSRGFVCLNQGWQTQYIHLGKRQLGLKLKKKKKKPPGRRVWLVDCDLFS